MTTHRIEITQRHLDNASTDPMGRQAIIDALRDAGMTRVWIKGNMCAMTHTDGTPEILLPVHSAGRVAVGPDEESQPGPALHAGAG